MHYSDDCSVSEKMGRCSGQIFSSRFRQATNPGLSPQRPTGRFVSPISQYVVTVFALAIVALMLAGCGGRDYGSSNRRSMGNGGRSGNRRLEAARDQLKRILLACHAYLDEYRCFPPAYSTDAEGRPLLSWRVLLLPFAGEADLYSKFHLDEAWNSEHNRELLAHMPRLYKTPDSGATRGRTNYLAIVGPRAVFKGPTCTKFAHIRDGSSITILVVEVNDQAAVEWTKPEDLSMDDEQLLDRLRGFRPQGFLVGFADGSTEVISSRIPLENLRSALTINGGEVIGYETFHP